MSFVHSSRTLSPSVRSKETISCTGIAGFLDVVEQDPRRTLRQLPHILPDGRQPGHTVLSQRNAVKTCDGNILRHTQPVIPQRTNCAERHQVGHGKHCRNVGTVL